MYDPSTFNVLKEEYPAFFKAIKNAEIALKLQGETLEFISSGSKYYFPDVRFSDGNTYIDFSYGFFLSIRPKNKGKEVTICIDLEKRELYQESTYSLDEIVRILPVLILENREYEKNNA